MKTLEEIKDACRIEEADSGSPHWIWGGGLTGKFPRIWAPDYTKTQQAVKDGKISRAAEPLMVSQHGRRAAYHLTAGKALPSGWRVYATCGEYGCVIHFGAGPAKEAGRNISAMGRYAGSIARQLASRAVGRQRAKLSAGDVLEIQQSDETGEALTRRFGVGRSTISRARRHGLPAHQPIGGMFSGLGARAAA